MAILENLGTKIRSPAVFVPLGFQAAIPEWSLLPTDRTAAFLSVTRGGEAEETSADKG